MIYSIFAAFMRYQEKINAICEKASTISGGGRWQRRFKSLVDSFVVLDGKTLKVWT
jgi:hypothetical protein